MCNARRDVIALLLFFLVPPPPTVGEAERITATQIRISWSPSTTSDSAEPVTEYFTVKYYPFSGDSRSRRAAESIAEFVRTTQNEVTINSLDPTLSYVVSVAATTEVGTGNFSNDITVGRE